MGGVITDICLVFPSISAVQLGYSVQAIFDALGSSWAVQEEITRPRMQQAGVVLTTTNTRIAELVQDWASPAGSDLIKLLVGSAPTMQPASRRPKMARTSTPEIPAFRSETAVINGVRLHYWLGGDTHGRPVLLWHGFLGTGYSWYKVMAMLVEAGHFVLVPDMRGYGDSDKPAGTDGYDARALAEEFRALVNQIEFGNGQKLILAAHDMGAPPALLWAADHPEEVARLVYMEVPTMLEEFLTRVIVYTPEAMAKGSMWWWILPLAPGVPERLIVGHERAFLTWFYEGATADPASITEESIQETLRSFSGTEGVLGALGVYRAAFTTIDQTTALKKIKVEVPVLAIGGEKALGAKVAQMVEEVAKNVTGKVVQSCGHFIPEEQAAEFMRVFQEFVGKVS